MSTIVDFFHNDGHKPVDLNYILRLRAVNNEIVDLAGNTWTASSNVSIVEDDFIKFDDGYLTYNTNGIIDTNEDFTISTWLIIDYIESGKDYHIFSGKYDPDPNIQYGDFAWIGYPASNDEFTPLVDPANSSNAWDTFNPTYNFRLSPEVNVLYHMAVTRENNYCRGFINGKLQSYITHNKRLIPSVGSRCMIGDWNLNVYYSWSSTRKHLKGRLKDLCIIKGKALWTKDFTPTTNYLPDKW